MSKVTRVFTGIADLPACKDPHTELIKIYNRVLRNLQDLPKDYSYRVGTEKLIRERKNIVETTPDSIDIEKKIGAGLCEELVEHARHELQLIETIKDYKPWEPIVEKPSADQWKWPM